MEYRNDFVQEKENGTNGSYQGYGGAQITVGEPGSSQNNSTFSIVSLVLGILSLVFVCCFFYVSFVMGAVGLILGIISLVQGRDGKGMAIAGTILNGISVLLAILIGVVYLAFGLGMEDVAADYMDDGYYEEAPYEYEMPSEGEEDWFAQDPAQLSSSDVNVK